MEAITIRKDFREAHNPQEAFTYEGLPALELAWMNYFVLEFD